MSTEVAIVSPDLLNTTTTENNIINITLRQVVGKTCLHVMQKSKSSVLKLPAAEKSGLSVLFFAGTGHETGAGDFDLEQPSY